MSAELWQLVAAILVMSMQAGFLLLEAGRVRTRNTINVAQKNAADLAVCWAIFIAFGYWLAFGKSSPLYLPLIDLQQGSEFLYQLGFCSAAATIISGAVAERMRFSAYLMLTIAVAGLIYPLVVWLAWGNLLLPERNAPLGSLGFQDFAGSTVVHGTAAWAALAAVLTIGPRIDKFDIHGNPRELPGHNPVLSMLGALILTLGWLGFNCGAIAPTSPVFAQSIVNTLAAAIAGGLAGMFIGYRVDASVFNPNRIIDGTLTGLVAITACVPYAQTWQAMLLGATATGIAIIASTWLEKRWKLDDPLGVISVHGLGGVIGTIAVAGLLPAQLLVGGSRLNQLALQIAGCAAVFAIAFSTTAVLLKGLSKIVDLRVHPEDEKLGLNFTEHGVTIDGAKLRNALSKSSLIDRSYGENLGAASMSNQDDAELAESLSELLKRHSDVTATAERQAERFRQFAATTNEVLWETDDQYCIRSIMMSDSQAYPGMDSSCIGLPFLQVFRSLESDAQFNYERMRAQQPIENFEAKYYSPSDKREYSFRVSGVPFYDADNRLLGYRGGASDVTQQKLAEERALFLANHDELTGLLNRRALSKLLEQPTDINTPATVAMIDLDGFKEINDRNGHQAGDFLLCGIAKRLRTNIRGEDRVFRIGGDEFVAILTGFGESDHREGALLWCERIIAILSEPFTIDGEEVTVGASIGMSMFPEDNEEFSNLIRYADLALYEAKSNGKGIAIEYRSEMIDAQQREHKLETDLLDAINDEQFFVVFQPKINLQNNTLSGCEALVRWRHPTRGVLPPVEFLSNLESLGLIGKLGEFVLKKACETATSWGRDDIHMSVNVSPTQLEDPNFVSMLEGVLRESKLPAERLELEITEECLITDYRHTVKTLQALRDLGVSIAVDDFGCGYTSLQYLYQFPVTRLKIDKSFVRNLMQDGRARDIAHSIIRMGQDIELEITAEGVEDSSHLDTLKSWGCDEAQGYLIARPLEEEEFRENWLDDNMRNKSVSYDQTG